MNRAEFDARIDSVLLYAEKLILKQTLPMELAPTVYDWYAFTFSYLNPAPFGYPLAEKNSLLSTDKRGFFSTK